MLLDRIHSQAKSLPNSLGEVVVYQHRRIATMIPGLRLDNDKAKPERDQHIGPDNILDLLQTFHHTHST